MSSKLLYRRFRFKLEDEEAERLVKNGFSPNKPKHRFGDQKDLVGWLADQGWSRDTVEGGLELLRSRAWRRDALVALGIRRFGLHAPFDREKVIERMLDGLGPVLGVSASGGEPMAQGALNAMVFTATGTFFAMDNMGFNLVLGYGGGGGGGSGGSNGTQASGGGAGGGSLPQSSLVVNSSNQTVTIGAGGTAGAAATGGAGNNGGLGADTTFGALAVFSGASGGGGGSASSGGYAGGGQSTKTTLAGVASNLYTTSVPVAGGLPPANEVIATTGLSMLRAIACGGGARVATAGDTGTMNEVGGFFGGAGGTVTSAGGGGGGGAGPGANGGAGGNGSATTTATAGASPAANTGAGAGGGGGTLTVTDASAAGGVGGSGLSTVVW